MYFRFARMHCHYMLMQIMFAFMQVKSKEFVLNWADLQVLLAFQREGTLQKAAAKLEIDISTVSC